MQVHHLWKKISTTRHSQQSYQNSFHARTGSTTNIVQFLPKYAFNSLNNAKEKKRENSQCDKLSDILKNTLFLKLYARVQQ